MALDDIARRAKNLAAKKRKGTITPRELAELEAIRAVRKRGRPISSAPPVQLPPSESPQTDATPPTETVASSPAAPGIVFDVSDLGPPDAPVSDAKPSEPIVSPPTPTEPSPTAANLAEKIVSYLVAIGGAIEKEWGIPPLLGMDFVAIPVLRRAWAVSLDHWGLAGKLEDLGSSTSAAQIAAVSSGLYLGGGGLYAAYLQRERVAKAAAEAEQAKAFEAHKPEAPKVETPKPAPAPPMPKVDAIPGLLMPQVSRTSESL